MTLAVYRSSAGSGKTYTLVKEYLKIVIKNPSEFRSILAITFTNKAANEMKERVILYLKHLIRQEEHMDSTAVEYLLPELEQSTNLSKQQIASRANRVLGLILHNYSDFAISTIDSFVYKIIRTFAYDINIPFDYSVELNTKDLIAKAVDLLISQAGNEEKLTRLLIHFTQSKAEREENWNIEMDLTRFGESLLEEESQKYLKMIRHLTLADFFEISRTLSSEIKKYENILYSIASSAMIAIEGENIPPQAFRRGPNGIWKYFNNIASRNFDKLEPNTFVLESTDKDLWHSKTATGENIDAINSIKADLLTAFNRIQDLRRKNAGRYDIYRLLYKSIYPLALLNEIEKVIEEIKSQNRIIPISEFNRRIADIVLNEPVPFIYERLGEKYKHFLIDEFQDTSVLQWHNLLPLVENALAYGTFNMLVGDGKQSIYRWRNGEVDQFACLPKIYKKEKGPVYDEREKSLIRNYEEVVLENNFRSKAEIIRFNNEFFSTVKEILNEDVKIIYNDLQQKYDENIQGGYIKIEFYNKNDEEQTKDDFNFNRVEQYIQEITDDGYELKDIAILCRGNRDASELARYLLDKEIAVISSQSLLLKSSPDIRFMISLFYWLKNPERIVLTEIMNWLVSTGKIKRQSFRKFLERDSKGIDQSELVVIFNSILTSSGYSLSAEKFLKFPAYELAEEFIRIFGLNTRADPYLTFFLDKLLEFTINKSTGVIEFLDWWEENKNELSIKAAEKTNAVRVMTIHKAKGLEFPVVIFPFADDIHRMTKKFLWVNVNDVNLSQLPVAMLPSNKQLENTGFETDFNIEYEKSMLDLVNIMYVAMTRPSDRLYIITVSPPENMKKVKSMQECFYSYLMKSNSWKDDLKVYTIGKRVRLSERSEIMMDDSYTIRTCISNDWKEKILLSTRAPEVWDIKDPEKNREWGNLVHSVLSRIKTIEEKETVINEFVQEGILDDGQAQSMDQLISQLLLDKNVKPFFAPGLEIKTESEILLSDGSSYRPDRLIINDKNTIVIDYKTGKPEENHFAQIRHYGRLLEEMDYQNVEKYLIYVEMKDKVVTVK